MAQPPPPLVEDLWEEILLRLPPEDPASLFRASLVCKQWRRIVSRRGFLRRLREIHRAPPMLGFFHNTNTGFEVVPTTTSATTLPVDNIHRVLWRVLDCRHGRVLLHSDDEFIIWEPISGYLRVVPEPDIPEEDVIINISRGCNAAVLCASDGCDHRSCEEGPYRVVFIYCTDEQLDDEDEDEAADGGVVYFTSARVYSSVTDMWGEEIEVLLDALLDGDKASVLAQDSLYFLLRSPNDVAGILKYNMLEHTLSAFGVGDWNEGAHLMQAEDGGLGFALFNNEEKDLRLFTWDEAAWGEAAWVPRRTIHLEHLPAAVVAGFAERANLILLTTEEGIFNIELSSGRDRKVCGRLDGRVDEDSSLMSLVGFYFPRRLPGDDGN